MSAPKGHKPYLGCETGGRPRRYSFQDVERFADELSIWLKDPFHLWLKDFCLDQDINPDLMTQWARENKKFAGVYAIAKQRQESRLVNGALTSQFNPGFTKFVLVNHHGWGEPIAENNKSHVQQLAESIRTESIEEAEDSDSEVD